MAKQTLKSLFGIDGDREQVELNLNPVNLSPTIRSGGNYSVAVQQTPLTNSALQLSDALKQGTQLYSQAVTLNRKRAETDVVTMSEEDFDKVVQEGLDKEGRSLFGYTKAYNQALAQKYYAEEIPKKLQNVSADLFKDPYKYKDATSFQAAAEDAATEIYSEADELLGNNVFAAKANNALKAATKSDFVTKQTDAFIRELPRITAKIQSDSAFRTFSELTDFDLVGNAIEGALTSAAGKMNNTDAADVVATAYFNEIDRAISDGETGRAEELLSQLNDDENGEGRRKFNGQEIFNTASRRIKIEDLEDKLEKEENKGLEQSKNTLVRAAADLRLSVVQEMGIDEDELAGQDLITTIENEIATTGTATINGIKYDDPLVVAGLDETLRQMKVSTSLFKEQAAGQFTDQNAGEKRAAVRQFKGVAFVRSISESAQEMLYEVVQDPLGTISKGFSAQGIAFESAFEAQLKIEEVNLAKSVLHLPRGEREAEYARLYNEKLRPSMQAFATDYLSLMVPNEAELIKQQEDLSALGEETIARFRIQANGDKQYFEALVSDELAKRDDLVGRGGRNQSSRRTNTLSESPKETYLRILDEENPTGEKKSKAYNDLRRDVIAEGKLAKILRSVSFSPVETEVQKYNKKKEARQIISQYGLDYTELMADVLGQNIVEFGKTRRRLIPTAISTIFNNKVDFSSFPILFNGSISPIIEAVNDPDNIEDGMLMALDNIALKYNVDLGLIIEGQRKLLQTNNFITK